MKMNLANKLTIFRIILVPIMVIIPFLGLNTIYTNSLIPLTWIIVEAIFITASITDKLDGYIARSRNQITTFGKFLDPLADKIIVLFREFIVSGYRLVAVGENGNVIAASIWGKLKTVTQMFALIFALIDMNPYAKCLSGKLNGFALAINIIATVLMTVSVIATIFSGWDYVKNGKELLKK